MQRYRLVDGWEHFRGSLGGVWEVWRADKLSNHFNVPWHEVRLPHCFNAEDAVDPDVTYYQGQGWYRRKLEVDNPYPEGRTLLHFEGAGQRTEVFVYTEAVGAHLGGYDEFWVDITEAAERVCSIGRYSGTVPIAVCCDNSRDLETIPSDAADFNLYGGLYRYVNLEYRPKVSIGSVHVEPFDVSQDSARVRVCVTLCNPTGCAEDPTVTVAIHDPAGAEVARVDTIHDAGFDVADARIDAPLLWSPDSPSLYLCRVELNGPTGSTTLEQRFGLRYFEFQERGPFFLNGERLLIRGTHRHEDHAGLGAAMPEDLIRRELSLIKDMGANFVRLGHYQQSRIVLDCCDDLGLLVWEEIPWCRGGLGGEGYRNQARSMLTSMIDQHYNHPSVIIWGLGNENDWECDFDYFDPDEIRRFMSELNDLAHELDPSRVTAIRRCEFCKDVVDVYSPSIWSGWYRGIYPDYVAHSRAAFEGTDRFVHMEWGADNVAGRHVEAPFTGFEQSPSGPPRDLNDIRGEVAGRPGTGVSRTDGAERDGDYLRSGGEPRVSRDGDWSETYFCDLVDWYLESQERMPWLTGSAQWVFKDFSTPVRPENPVPYVNMKGVVERDLTPKEAYFVFQSYWSKRPMVRIYGHARPLRWGEVGMRKIVRVYSNCPRVELFLNGRSCGVRDRIPDDFPCAGLRWYLQFEKGENELEAVAVGEQVRDRLVMQYQTDVWGEPARLLASVHREHSGRARVEVRLVDDAGVLCADASRRVRFTLAGDGRLLDNLGTVSGSRVVELANGGAVIHVETAGGISVIGVSAGGLETTFAKIG